MEIDISKSQWEKEVKGLMFDDDHMGFKIAGRQAHRDYCRETQPHCSQGRLPKWLTILKCTSFRQ